MIVDFDDIVEAMRTMAKSNYWQTLYVQSKEINGVNLFNNINDFTYIQIEFLNNISFYNSIYFDISLGEVDEMVLEDEIYTTSYAYYKNKERKLPVDNKKPIMTQKIPSVQRLQKESIVEQDQFIFRTK